MISTELTAGRDARQSWSSIDWPAVERNVRRLQERIFRASQDGEPAKVKSLQKLLVRSSSAKLLAIRKATQINRGKRTPGIDGVVCHLPPRRLAMFRKGLSLRGYHPKPVRRVYIPKADGKERPLGIPTMLDRVMQALVKLALEPEWEPRFEANSYGFRPGRCTMDAIEALHRTLSKPGSSQWILDADIAKCFDRIEHAALLGRLPVFTTTIRRWLNAGVVELGALDPTTMGTPQGGIISPLLANIALDGMERLFGAERPDGRQIAPKQRRGQNWGISLIRYADDFVVTAPSREVLEGYVIPRVAEFLASRGLELSQAKTRIVHIDDGFDFLGFNLRHFPNGKLLARPQKEKVALHRRRLSEDTRRGHHRGAGIRAGTVCGEPDHSAPHGVFVLRSYSPVAVTVAPHRERPTGTGVARACTGQQICGSPATLSPVADLRARGYRSRPLDPRRLGRQVRRPAGAAG